MNKQMVLSVIVAAVFGAAVSWLAQWVIQPGNGALERRIAELEQVTTGLNSQIDSLKEVPAGCFETTDAGVCLTVDRLIVPAENAGLADVTIGEGQVRLHSAANSLTLAANLLHAAMLVSDSAGHTRIEASYNGDQTRVSLSDENKTPRIVMTHNQQDRVLGIGVNNTSSVPQWMVVGADETGKYAIVNP